MASSKLLCASRVCALSIARQLSSSTHIIAPYSHIPHSLSIVSPGIEETWTICAFTLLRSASAPLW